ncbi:HAMP domain-containing histidine kinase [Variovorax paradoxus]|nr:HAMP domain-containing histidine kinase [Variovorax paradoxus]
MSLAVPTEGGPAGALQRLWQRVSEPSLVRRGTGWTLLVFFLIWAALLSYAYIENRKYLAEAPGLRQFGDALLLALDETPDPAHARAIMAATERWTAIRRTQDKRLGGIVLYELLDREGGEVYASAGWAQAAAAPDRPERYWSYDRAGTHWRLQVLNPRRTGGAFLRYNARAFLPYLLVAFPFVLLAVWLTVRASLRPLQQLARRIEERPSDDLSAVGVPARYRELKPLVQALDALLSRLRGTVARERAFVQDAAHEIRTPLAVINAQAHVLAHAQDPAERALAETQLNQAIARTSHLARQLLDLAALDRAGPRCASRVDVAHWLRALLGPAAQAAMREGRELSLDAPDALPCSIDLGALESIVQNLVDNALRHGVPGSMVAVDLRDADGQLLFEVRDDGPGIAASQREHLFERFHRGAEPRASGAGLGLAIARQAALRLGGSVEIVDGLQGRGVGFRVRLPRMGDKQIP